MYPDGNSEVSNEDRTQQVTQRQLKKRKQESDDLKQLQCEEQQKQETSKQCPKKAFQPQEKLSQPKISNVASKLYRIVWAKWGKNSFYPALTITKKDAKKNISKTGRQWILWLEGENRYHRVTEQPDNYILPFQNDFVNFYKNSNKMSKPGIFEALRICAKMSSIDSPSDNDLLNWGINGFDGFVYKEKFIKEYVKVLLKGKQNPLRHQPREEIPKIKPNEAEKSNTDLEGKIYPDINAEISSESPAQQAQQSHSRKRKCELEDLKQLHEDMENHLVSKESIDTVHQLQQNDLQLEKSNVASQTHEDMDNHVLYEKTIDIAHQLQENHSLLQKSNVASHKYDDIENHVFSKKSNDIVDQLQKSNIAPQMNEDMDNHVLCEETIDIAHQLQENHSQLQKSNVASHKDDDIENHLFSKKSIDTVDQLQKSNIEPQMNEDMDSHVLCEETIDIAHQLQENHSQLQKSNVASHKDDDIENHLFSKKSIDIVDQLQKSNIEPQDMDNHVLYKETIDIVHQLQENHSQVHKSNVVSHHEDMDNHVVCKETIDIAHQLQENHSQQEKSNVASHQYDVTENHVFSKKSIDIVDQLQKSNVSPQAQSIQDAVAVAQIPAQAVVQVAEHPSGQRHVQQQSTVTVNGAASLIPHNAQAIVASIAQTQQLQQNFDTQTDVTSKQSVSDIMHQPQQKHSQPKKSREPTQQNFDTQTDVTSKQSVSDIMHQRQQKHSQPKKSREPTQRNFDTQTDVTSKQSVSDIMHQPQQKHSQPEKSCEPTQLYSIVWGKWSKNSAYPAITIKNTDAQKKPSKPHYQWIMWLEGENKCHQVTEQRTNQIFPFTNNFMKMYKNASKGVKYAIMEALTVCAEMSAIESRDEVSLIHWAKNGFNGFINSEKFLKEYVLTILGNKQTQENVCERKQIKEIKRSDKDQSENGRSSSSALIEQVRKGERYLEEVPICCRRIDKPTVIDHPLFVGKACGSCHMDVHSIVYDLEKGEMKDYCVICAQKSENLVYCHAEICSRAYCRNCIITLDSKEAYERIVNDKNWLCYLSEKYHNYSRKNGNLLIKQKVSITHRTYILRKHSFRRYRHKKHIIEGGAKINVLEGNVNLEDICIVCHKSEWELNESRVSLVVHHPLFFGSICEICQGDVERVCKLRYGKIQDFCIVCGQSGYLVYCSKTECSRAYCKKCIDFWDSDVAFTKIVEDISWLCYLCYPSENKKCLIQKRFPPDNYFYDDETRLEVYKPKFSIDDAAKKLQTKELTLRDVCIACLAYDIDYPMQHPLFKGLVCLKCSQFVQKACELYSGEYHDLCVICGHGGQLIYCSNKQCSRVYCRPCIDYLDSEDAYEAIKKKENWFCYFCDLHPPKKCLIKRKEIKQQGVRYFPSIPKEKRPINVLAFDDTGCKALKKADIKIDNYHTEDKDDLDLHYDLLLGSFFVGNEKKTRESFVKDFMDHFNIFNTRRKNCQFHNDHEVFFIFIGEYSIMDANILYEVVESIHAFHRQYCTVRPLLFKFGEKKFLAWSNLRYCVPQEMIKPTESPYVDQCEIKKRHFNNNKTVELEIYLHFLEYLKNYFQSNN